MTEKIWRNEFRQIEFEFEGRYATLVFPPEGTENGRWMLKTEYFGAFPSVEIKLLRKGYHLAYLRNVNRIGTDIDTDAKARFAEFLHMSYGLSQKCVPVGMSCGGLQAVNFAAKYPSLVSVLYLDAPVMNFLSWPFGMGDCFVDRGPVQQKEVLDALGMTKSEIFFKIILLQVVKRIIPPMSNEIITLIKDTSLANTIVVYELIFEAKEFMLEGLIWPLFAAGAFYLVFVGILTILFNKAEKKLDYFKA